MIVRFFVLALFVAYCTSAQITSPATQATASSAAGQMLLTFSQIGSLVTAAAAVGIAIWGVRVRRRDEHWNDQLQRLDNQLGTLYGPMYALINGGDETWHGFLRKYSPDKRPDGFRRFLHKDWYGHKTSDDELAVFRLYTRAAFLPTNAAIAELIVRHPELLIGFAMPTDVLEFCRHVDSMRAKVRLWDSLETKGQTPAEDQHHDTFNNPPDFHRRVRATYRVLTESRKALLHAGRKRGETIDEKAFAEKISTCMIEQEKDWGAERRVLYDFESEHTDEKGRRIDPRSRAEVYLRYGEHFSNPESARLEKARRKILPVLHDLYKLNGPSTQSYKDVSEIS